MSSYGATTLYPYPSTLLRITSKDLDDFLKEAEEFYNQGDLIQSCEKFYKIAEEIVKILAELYAPNAMKKVNTRLRKHLNPWDIKLLYEAVDEIIRRAFSDNWERKIFINGWRSAINLHRDCFHDFLLSPTLIKDAIDNVKGMIKISKELLKRIEISLFSSDTVNNY